MVAMSIISIGGSAKSVTSQCVRNIKFYIGIVCRKQILHVLALSGTFGCARFVMLNGRTCLISAAVGMAAMPIMDFNTVTKVTSIERNFLVKKSKDSDLLYLSHLNR